MVPVTLLALFKLMILLALSEQAFSSWCREFFHHLGFTVERPVRPCLAADLSKPALTVLAN